MLLSAQSKDGASISLVESGAGKPSKLPLSTSDILGLYYCAKGQPQRPSQCNLKIEPRSIMSKAVRQN
jgi:hypothetical protein